MARVTKTAREIERIRRSGRILAEVLMKLRNEVRPGVTTLQLDTLARRLIEQAGASPAFLGYKPAGAASPFPYTICTSVNHVVVHGRPSQLQLQEGDIVSLDIGVNWQGGITDAAVTLPVGKVSQKAHSLIQATERALRNGIQAAIAGNTLGDIGYAIESTLQKEGFEVVEGLTGHGVGRAVHEEPAVYNFGKPGEGMRLSAGMVLAIEPMASVGGGEIIQLSDDSFATKDNSLSAHFEHTVLIQEGEAEILTAI